MTRAAFSPCRPEKRVISLCHWYLSEVGQITSTFETPKCPASISVAALYGLAQSHIVADQCPAGPHGEHELADFELVNAHWFSHRLRCTWNLRRGLFYFCRFEAAQSAARQLFGIMNAVFCEFHYSGRDQVEVARICGADYLPHLFEGRAHVRGELGNNLFRTHRPTPAPTLGRPLNPGAYHQPLTLPRLLRAVEDMGPALWSKRQHGHDDWQKKCRHRHFHDARLWGVSGHEPARNKSRDDPTEHDRLLLSPTFPSLNRGGDRHRLSPSSA